MPHSSPAGRAPAFRRAPARRLPQCGPRPARGSRNLRFVGQRAGRRGGGVGKRVARNGQRRVEGGRMRPPVPPPPPPAASPPPTCVRRAVRAAGGGRGAVAVGRTQGRTGGRQGRDSSAPSSQLLKLAAKACKKRGGCGWVARRSARPCCTIPKPRLPHSAPMQVGNGCLCSALGSRRIVRGRAGGRPGTPTHEVCLKLLLKLGHIRLELGPHRSLRRAHVSCG